MNEELKDLPVLPSVDGNTRAYGDNGTVDGALTINQIKSVIAPSVGNFNVKGAWDASTNTPALASGVGTPWEAYVVTTGGNTALDGVKSWAVDDILWFNGTNNQWQRLTNAQYSYPLTIVGIFDAVTGDAADCNFQPIGTLTSGVGIPWQAYGVANPGNYDLDGNVDWKIGQVAMFNGITKQWFKFPILSLNGRTGAFETFPATQGELMFGSADNWFDQDGNLFWDKALKMFKCGNNNTLINSPQSSCIGGDSNNITNSYHSVIDGGDGNNITNSPLSHMAASSGSTIQTDSNNSYFHGVVGCTATNSPNSSIKNSSNSQLENDIGCSIENAFNGVITNADYVTVKSSQNVNVNGGTNVGINALNSTGIEGSDQNSFYAAGDNATIKQNTNTFCVAGNKNNYQNNLNCSINAGYQGIVTDCTESQILPGNQNDFSFLVNSVAGGGIGNVVKNAGQGVFLGNGGINVDLISGFAWNCILSSLQITNSSPLFTSIVSTNINGGDTSVAFTTYINASAVENNNNLSNLLVMGQDNSSLFVPQYSNQANLFYDKGLSINRPNDGIGGLITTSLSVQETVTSWPLSNYQMTINDYLVLGKYAGTSGANSLTLVLPDETDLPSGRIVEYWNDSTILPGAANVQSATGKQIRISGVGALTQNINFSGALFHFVWIKSQNYWVAQRLN
jgi:hypothetical protein